MTKKPAQSKPRWQRIQQREIGVELESARLRAIRDSKADPGTERRPSAA
jgi:hypothetical protein